MNDIKGKKIYNADEDKSLPICWKGSKPFKSIQDVKKIFKPIMLTFENSKNVRFQMDPESYLIISVRSHERPKNKYLFTQCCLTFTFVGVDIW